MAENHQRKAKTIMLRLAEVGPDLHRPHADAVRGKIRELRCGIGTFEHRFLFFFDGHRVLLTHGFLKKSDSIPEREKRHLTQKQLAERSGMRQAAIARLESGRHSMTLRTLQGLAAAMGCSVSVRFEPARA